MRTLTFEDLYVGQECIGDRYKGSIVGLSDINTRKVIVEWTFDTFSSSPFTPFTEEIDFNNPKQCIEIIFPYSVM